jgi:hypothetical protein
VVIAREAQKILKIYGLVYGQLSKKGIRGSWAALGDNVCNACLRLLTSTCGCQHWRRESLVVSRSGFNEHQTSPWFEQHGSSWRDDSGIKAPSQRKQDKKKRERLKRASSQIYEVSANSAG